MFPSFLLLPLFLFLSLLKGAFEEVACGSENGTSWAVSEGNVARHLSKEQIKKKPNGRASRAEKKEDSRSSEPHLRRWAVARCVATLTAQYIEAEYRKMMFYSARSNVQSSPVVLLCLRGGLRCVAAFEASARGCKGILPKYHETT